MKRKVIAGSAIKTPFEFFIQWHLTERCNLRCLHCYQAGSESIPEMNPAEVCKEIDGATEMFQAWEREYSVSVSPSIHFTGGEPFLYEGLWDVILHARERGYGVAIMTNGTEITKKDARQAVASGLTDIQVSLEGPPDLHDSIRGRGSFAAAVGGVKRLLEAGNRVSLNMTLSRVNVGKIEETVEIAGALGVQTIGFSRVVPCGRGRGLKDRLLSPGEVREAYLRIFSLNHPSLEVISGDPLASILLAGKPSAETRLTLSGCSAGFSGVTITCDGSVMPCRRIGLTVGNLRRKSLRAIWASSPILWRLRERESYHGKCGSCSFWPSCRGCRAIAYAHSALQGQPDLFADDPQCWVSVRDQGVKGQGAKTPDATSCRGYSKNGASSASVRRGGAWHS